MYVLMFALIIVRAILYQNFIHHCNSWAMLYYWYLYHAVIFFGLQIYHSHIMQLVKHHKCICKLSQATSVIAVTTLGITGSLVFMVMIKVYISDLRPFEMLVRHIF